MLISEAAPEADPAGTGKKKRQEIIPGSAMGNVSKSGDLHGEKDENGSYRVQQCMGDFNVCGYPCKHLQ